MSLADRLQLLYNAKYEHRRCIRCTISQATPQAISRESNMDPVWYRLSQNVAAVRSSIAVACNRVGRSPEEVRLLAVTKYARPEWIEGLIALGLSEFGENRPQQLVERQSRWPQVQWHLIGHLQRNKVDLMIGRVALVHSVDSLRLAKRLSETTQENTVDSLPCLCEVNISGEESKDGFTSETLRSCWSEILTLPGVRVQGLMTMAPLTSHLVTVRSVFQQLRLLRDELRLQSPSGVSLPELSMGMSGDFEIAIEEGATLIRVGSRLFEGLG